MNTQPTLAQARPDLPADRAANLAENPHAGQGAVMLDIGGDVGAIVVHFNPRWEGVEIEIEPLHAIAAAGAPDHQHEHTNEPDHTPDHDHPHEHTHEPHEGQDSGREHTRTHQQQRHGHRPHVAVVGRPVGAEIAYSAVFPDLHEGRYALGAAGSWDRASAVEVEVTGGQVTEIDWPGSAPLD